MENFSYQGCIPPLSEYLSKNDDDVRVEKIKKFHQEKMDENYFFSFSEEIVKYCRVS